MLAYSDSWKLSLIRRIVCEANILTKIDYQSGDIWDIVDAKEKVGGNMKKW